MKTGKTSHQTVLVIGGGKYGAKACRYFKAQQARVMLVDTNPACQARPLVARRDFILQDAKDAWELAFNLKPDFIVPTHPGHTLGKWTSEYFHLQPLSGALGPVKQRLPPSLIRSGDESKAALIASFMAPGARCRANCLPPPHGCAVTGDPRPAPLYRLLEYAVHGRFDCSKIFVAAQLTAGIGAIKTPEFLAFIKEVEIKKPKTLAVGTACQCHGVLNLYAS